MLRCRHAHARICTPLTSVGVQPYLSLVASCIVYTRMYVLDASSSPHCAKTAQTTCTGESPKAIKPKESQWCWGVRTDVAEQSWHLECARGTVVAQMASDLQKSTCGVNILPFCDPHPRWAGGFVLRNPMSSYGHAGSSLAIGSSFKPRFAPAHPVQNAASPLSSLMKCAGYDSAFDRTPWPAAVT